MILPEGCDYRIELNSPQSINSLVSNRDHSIFVVSTDTFLYFYLADTHLLACIYQKDDDDTAERGFFRDVYWKPDSTAIAVTTSKNFVNIYNVEVSSESSFNLHDPVGDGTDFTRESTELFMNKSRPRINVNLVVVARLESTPTCILTFKEEFIVCLKDGWLHRLSWSGSILHDLSFNIRSVHHDQANPTKNSLQGLDYFVSDIAPFLGGICIVYSDGRAALIVSSILEFRPGSISILFAGGLNDACCCSTNFKFRLLYFGCTNGDIAAYSPNDVDGGLMQLFRVRLFAKDCTEQLSHISSVRQINCLSPSGCAFAVLWNSKVSAEQKYTCTHLENNSFKFSKTNDCHLSCSTVLAIFSPFGEQWWCSLEDKTVASVNINESHPFGNYEYTSMDWSLEGYQLWLGTSNANLHFINMVKSIQGMHDALVLVGSDRIFVCPTNQHSQFSSAPHLIWQLIKPPHGYINTNGPIKHASISRQYTSNKILLIGGSHGFCFCNLKNTKWRMFRKEAQEKSLFLTGGINLFESFILCSAYNLDSKDERLYIFRLEDQLDTDLAHFISTNRILQMKICGSFLLMFGVDSMISIYSLSVQSKINGLQIECIAEIRIAEFLHHPNCLISMELARLNFHSDAMPFCGDFDSLLINASGHLLLLSPMLQNLNGHHKEISNDNIMEFQLHPPTLVASLVEEFWIVHPLNFTYDIEQYNCRIPYLSNALWINAGSRKCRLWLPLSINAQNENISTDVSTPQNSRAFISRRIMIPFNLEIYPLFIDHNYLACGASVNFLRFPNITDKVIPADDVSILSEFTEDEYFNDSISVTRNREDFVLSVHSLVKTYEVFIHKLIKQLLKRNLGSYAFDLASACSSISHFGHILELLLHDLLDEEASSSEPIPDPLLPRVVSFLREFPNEYLQTVIFCARKTELAYWNVLFFISNHPRQLFQMCLDEDRLELATSCLVILHSLTSINESSKLAFKLLEEAKGKQRWRVAQDIIRFMQNINRATEKDSDIESIPTSPIQGKLTSHHQHVTPFNLSNDDLSFPLFSSQTSFAQQRRISVSGKSSDISRHITAYTGIRRLN